MLEFKEYYPGQDQQGILKFPEKKEAMVIDEDPFSLVAPVNIVASDLRAGLNEKKDGRFYPNARIRKVSLNNILFIRIHCQ